MNDKELDDYIKTISPNFNIHIGKGTIEMNNEYYNLLREKTARLVNENQELKKQNEELEVKYKSEHTMKVHFGIQQKKFIKWLEDGIQKIKNTEFLDERIQRAALVAYNRCLRKYKSIIGDDINEHEKSNK